MRIKGKDGFEDKFKCKPLKRKTIYVKLLYFTLAGLLIKKILRRIEEVKKVLVVLIVLIVVLIDVLCDSVPLSLCVNP